MAGAQPIWSEVLTEARNPRDSNNKKSMSTNQDKISIDLQIKLNKLIKEARALQWVQETGGL